LREDNSPTRITKLFEAVLDATPASKVRRGILIASQSPATIPVEAVAKALGNGSLVTASDTVPFALWCAAHHLDNYVDSLALTISGGGDCDNDRRIKAVATVSAVNIGAMFRNGWLGNVKSADAIPYLEAGAKERTDEANGAAMVTMPLAPMRKEDAPDQDLLEAWEYYHTPRAQHPTAPGFATTRSLTQLITYDAFNFADVFLTQPLLIIAGSVAASKWMSDDLFKRAASKDKTLHVVEGANHMSLYDVPKFVGEAAGKLSGFFKAKL
jgi:fermentation-respiration switch protein FrsA (DUF1100 family)